MKLDFLKTLPKEWQKQVYEYLDGKRRMFDIDIELEGTDFQKAVWGEMLKIPYGETRTYTEIAEAICKPKAVRAVGTACGQNKLLIIVPCHRVVAKNGLGGYALGLEMKQKLLDLEKEGKY